MIEGIIQILLHYKESSGPPGRILSSVHLGYPITERKNE